MLTALHFLTHIGLSWIVANAGRRASRDRWLIIAAGVLPDLDGVGILWSEPAYVAVHRAAGHGLLFIALWTLGVVRYAERPMSTVALAVLSFHLHLLLDAVGTGGLPIRYFWPLSDAGWSYAGRWTLASWPNAVVMTLTLLGVLLIALRTRSSGRRAADRGSA
jgi:inner membrane protein